MFSDLETGQQQKQQQQPGIHSNSADNNRERERERSSSQSSSSSVRGYDSKPHIFSLSSFFRNYQLAMMKRPQTSYILAAAAIIIFLYWIYSSSSTTRSSVVDSKIGESGIFRIAVVTDLDERSKEVGKDGKVFWRSYMRHGTLTRNHDGKGYSIVFDDEGRTVSLRSRLNLDDRGMELSWLQNFNGNLLSGDDRSGVVFKIEGNKAIAFYVLPDGDGTEEKGFKSEWATVKDNVIYIGSFGKEWSSDEGEFINDNPQWVKVIDKYGTVTHVNWRQHWEKMRQATGHEFPGYLFHESGAWNSKLRKWVFVPRRASKDRYNPAQDEVKGTNIMYICSEDFKQIEVRHIKIDLDPVSNPKGFSEIKFIPGSDDILALRTYEHDGAIRSWITAFNLQGEILLDEEHIGNYKFEGLEFIP